MPRMTRLVLLASFLAVACTSEIRANTLNAASCFPTDVQAAINSASEGDTVVIPSGVCTWTGAVTIAGKGVTVLGAGSARVVAYAALASALAIGTGSKSWAISGFSPGFSGSVFATGATITAFELGNHTNFMTGTVTSFTGGTLTLNVLSSNGTCGNQNQSNCKRWIFHNNPTSATVIQDGTSCSSVTPLFTITEDSSVHTSIGNIQFVPGTCNQHVFKLQYASGGQAILIHDIWISESSSVSDPPDGDPTMIISNSDRGVVWNCSFDGSPFNISTLGAVGIKDATNVTGAWTTQSFWGTLDTTGQNNFYVETSDFHALGFATSVDDNGRLVARYNLYDSSGMMGTHGADTSFFGQRYFESYNNTAVFEGYSDGTTFNFNQWYFIRGGSFVIHDNTIPSIVSQDFGTKSSVRFIIENLQRNSGPDPCWGAGFSAAGQFYPAPRQPGFGRVTGNGTANYPPLGVNNSHTDSVTYVGDSEPAYIWANNTVPLPNVNTSDYGGNACTNPDSSTIYIVLNRDFFNGNTPKPAYSPFTYPHPLVTNTPTANPPTAPVATAH